MKTRLLHVLEMISANFWMIPVFFLLSATALAFFNFYLDKTLLAHHIDFPDLFLYFNNSQSIRALLSVSAGSVLGVAGVSFSITIASLTLASQQFGPRLLNNFMLDRFNQTILGIFIGTFWYCILMLQFTSSMDLEKTTPFISMIGVLILVVINLLALVFFIHHIAVSIQADSVIAEVSTTLKSQIESLFPEPYEQTDDLPEVTVPENINNQFEQDGQIICSDKSGYLQAIDIAGLIKFITEEDIALNIQIKPGDFIIEGNAMGQYLAKQEAVETVNEKVHNYFIIGSKSTAEQDPEYAIRQLVEVAVRALSPGINDPFTAISCINRLGDNIAFIINRKFPVEDHFDDTGKLRLRIKPVTFNGIVETSFNQIRQHGRSDIAVIIHLLQTLLRLSKLIVSSNQAKALKTQADALYSSCDRSLNTDKDQHDLKNVYNKIKKILEKNFSI